ncbi:DUF11 domain-containing protein [Paenibacillus sp. SC116]|uniref:DUF11 domain-containing protein n=1 Tax=Paenibacillus sp. SC116 TaxID=2968986 RepID=UPI00215AF834|nr:DUF11 domain-containing protein [Paenibacillus sp. SC116]MCR8842656.1 DUF11 domain-containing protein [Paenibacillus sp. SC116]
MSKKETAASDLTNTKALVSTLDHPHIELNKSVNKDEAKVKDVLTFTVLVTNTGAIDAQKAILKDVLPKELKFVLGSVFVDGVSQPNAHISSGVPLGTVLTEQLVAVTFQAQIVNIPPDEIVKNTAKVTFEFESMPGAPVTNGEAISNETRTKLIVRPLTNCEKSQATVEFSIAEQEKAVQALLDVEAEKGRAAHQAVKDGKIASGEQQLIDDSKNRTTTALAALSQELANKRTANQDLCKGCK